MSRRKKYVYNGCDKDCMHCPYPDCMIPPAEAARGIKTDTWVFMKDGVSAETGKPARMKKSVLQRGRPPTGRAVRCIETGEVFLNAAEAERRLNIWSSLIRKCCNGKAKTAGGYRWEYIKNERTHQYEGTMRKS